MKTIFKTSGYLLLFILFLAGVLRLLNLGSVPPGLTPDEAALGYNAYSILKTGKDEHGKFLPVIFKSFGDNKPGLYVYLATPFIALSGLNEFSVRILSALAGILSVYLIYLICYIWFGKRVGLVAAFIASINPYLIYFARGAWEANVSLTLTLFGIYFFLKSLYKPNFLTASSIFFASTLLMYQGAKLSTLIVVVLLVMTNWKEFWKLKPRYLYISFILGLLISIPIIVSLFNGQSNRLTIFSVFSYPRPESELTLYAGKSFELFHSNSLNYIRMILSRLFNFYSGQFLFFAGDIANPVHTPPYQGALLISDILLLPLGVFYLFRQRIKKGYLFIFLWLILAPFSAAITRDQTNAVRSLNTAIPLVIVIAFGLNALIEWLSNRVNTSVVFALLFTFYLLPFTYLLDAYFVHLPIHNSEYSRYGYREVVKYVSAVQKNYKIVYFEQSFNQPYIYFLFYQKYNPLDWQKQSMLVDSEYKGDVGYQTNLDNIVFDKIDWVKLKDSDNTLIVTSPTNVPAEIMKSGHFRKIKEVKYLNNKYSAFLVFETK